VIKAVAWDGQVMHAAPRGQRVTAAGQWIATPVPPPSPEVESEIATRSHSSVNMPQTAVKIGPQDQGRRMSLADFEQAETQEGDLYELGRGVIVVSDVPKPSHAVQIATIRDQLTMHKLRHPGQIWAILGSHECKIPIALLDSERHPDLAVYKTPPPRDDDEVWSVWIPELVIEVVSLGSGIRDYEEKPDEYLAFGVQEYWIVDGRRREVLVLRRSRGRWVDETITPDQVYRPLVLPGFEFACGPVFDSAKPARRRRRS
jgi:Uma2 family endonuclease